MAAAYDLIVFWRVAGPKAWFGSDPEFDKVLRERFGTLHSDALAGLLGSWSDTAEGALALVLLLDQLSRNLYRNSPRAFAGDKLALKAAEATVRVGHDLAIGTDLRPFLYLPFEHAETLEAQERSVALTAKFARETGITEPLRWANHHRAIITRFGRFPHRNAILGRTSTSEESMFLSAGGFSG